MDLAEKVVAVGCVIGGVAIAVFAVVRATDDSGSKAVSTTIPTHTYTTPTMPPPGYHPTTPTTPTAKVKLGASGTDTMISWIGNNYSILAKVSTATGQPDPGVLVTARAKNGGQAISATTGSDGVATISGITTGEWDVSSPAVAGAPQPTMMNLPGWVFGTCGGSVPPAPDPCDSIQSIVRGMWLSNVYHATLYKSWAAANPGENQKFKAYLQNPYGPVPQMATFTGAMLVNVVTMYAQAKGPAPLPWPPPVAPQQ